MASQVSSQDVKYQHFEKSMFDAEGTLQLLYEMPCLESFELFNGSLCPSRKSLISINFIELFYSSLFMVRHLYMQNNLKTLHRHITVW